MRSKLFYISVLFLLTFYSATGQKDTTISPATLKQLTGCWHGTLNYSGTIIRKPYTTTAELIVKQIGTSSKFEFLHIYTQNPNENIADTFTISADGKELNNENIISGRCTADGNLEIVTASQGFDHDNNKAAIIRQTYTIGKQHYSYKKEIQLEGQTDWLTRQDFTYVRKACSSKL
jgi:hypothetical protein